MGAPGRGGGRVIDSAGGSLRPLLRHLEQHPDASKLEAPGASAFVSQALRPFLIAAVADRDVSLLLSGNGDVLEPEGGLIGIGFWPATCGGTDAAAISRAIVRAVEVVGLEHVALGSDFDGATIPAAIGDAGGLQALVRALAAAGYGPRELEAICRENWLRTLAAAWGETRAETAIRKRNA